MLTFTEWNEQRVARERENAELDRISRYVFRKPYEINISGKTPVDIHIYKVDEDGEIKKSCCGGFNLTAKQGAGDSILSSEDARKKALEGKRFVCGRCVASLYSNKDTSEL